MRRAWFVGVAGLAIVTASVGCSSGDGTKAQQRERQLAIADTEMFLSAGNARPGGYRISRATRVKADLWRVEVTAPREGGRAQHSCFTIRLDRFYVHTTATDNVSSRGIGTSNRGCP